MKELARWLRFCGACFVVAAFGLLAWGSNPEYYGGLALATFGACGMAACAVQAVRVAHNPTEWADDEGQRQRSGGRSQ